MPGVTYTERTVTDAGYFEGRPSPGGGISEGFALFGMPIPLSSATVWADPTAIFTERTVVSGSHTERPVNSTAYTERTV